jgi:putative transposase
MANVPSTLCLCPSISIGYLWILGLSCCESALRETAVRVGRQLYALQVGADHVHIFVGLHPACSASRLISLLKCNSARRLFEEYPELKCKLWRGSLWSRCKFYRLIGQVNAETIKRYIGQSKHQ